MIALCGVQNSGNTQYWAGDKWLRSLCELWANNDVNDQSTGKYLCGKLTKWRHKAARTFPPSLPLTHSLTHCGWRICYVVPVRHLALTLTPLSISKTGHLIICTFDKPSCWYFQLQMTFWPFPVHITPDNFKASGHKYLIYIFFPPLNKGSHLENSSKEEVPPPFS